MNDKYKDYKPELVEYDEEIDGGIDEYKTRDKHLDVKANLLDKIRQKKAAAKGNQTTFRQNIRTENSK